MSNRRTFIKQAGLLSAALYFTQTSCSPKKAAGLQLYTLGDLSKDVNGTMRKVAAAGYHIIETSGYTESNKFWGLPAKEFAGVLNANGQHSPSGLYFFDLNGNLDDLKHFIEAAATVGQKYLVQPWLLEEWRKSADDYKRIAQKLNEAGELTRKSGISMGYHNHDFEFKNYSGKTGFDILLEETEPGLVKIEMDIYWVVRGGIDPVELFKKYPGRFPLWHVKDMDKADPKRNTEVGNGKIDFKEIFSNAALAGLDQPFVEQENFTIDPYESIARSAAYLKGIY
ncbi:sugar phosphate isomerase/epimerase [Mucilaginibacter hurinus]|uniref:Sugar phosphate isomerase/epimerase n=1 Tax=Mucilaginibacter hurinus TaxID=2201324 RepID=A0A367GS25_9SPHI|nr:sugar phosphate isomerase/epimerase [Mucilaginibacter hurinus]RCH56249.1 sugar phosphate isomerase/epimerase [Mucilaginibacter hurinus]